MNELQNRGMDEWIGCSVYIFMYVILKAPSMDGHWKLAICYEAFCWFVHNPHELYLSL